MWLCKFSSNAYGLCLFEWLFVPHTLPALVHSKVHLILILRSYIQHTADCHGDGISFVTDDESQWQWQWPDHHWDLKISMMEFHLFMPSRAAGLLHNNHSACCLALASLLVVWGGIVTTGVRLESDTQGSDTRSRVQVGGVYVMYLYTILNDKSCLSFHHNQTQRQRTLPAVRRQSESCVECVWTKQVGMCVMSEIYPWCDIWGVK